VSAFASADWAADPIDPIVEAFAAAGGSAAVLRVITGGPDGEVRYLAIARDGAVAYEPAGAAEPDVSLTDTVANARAVLDGELDPNAAFMRGQTKVTGPTSTLLDLFAAAKGEAFAAARARALAALG
jgi:putative sterol carrier protein